MKITTYQTSSYYLATRQDEQLKAQEARLKELEAKLNAILNK